MIHHVEALQGRNVMEEDMLQIDDEIEGHKPMITASREGKGMLFNSPSCVFRS